MRLTVLGCQSPYPGPNGATPGYLLQTEETNLLIDCGSGVISQLHRYLPLYQLDAVCLSHYHHDHIADVGVLQYGIMLHQKFKDRANGPLPIYGPSQAEERGLKLTYQEATVFKEVNQHSVIQIGDCTVSFHRTQHDAVCYAMKVEHKGKVVVYGADSGPDTVWLPFAEGADLFICEGTFLEKDKPNGPIGHLSVRQASMAAEQIGCRHFVVTHLFPAYTQAEVRAEMAPYTRGKGYVAQIGLEIQL